jgi:ATP/maltotriose-dependent transcriptional regulator MalT
VCERVDRYTADADRTGDRFLSANLRSYLSIVWLVRDNPERAAKDLAGTLEGWPADTYHVQHFFHLYARCEQALYADKPESAFAAIQAERSRLASSGQLKVSGLRIENAWISGRVALAVAESKPMQERAPLLRMARQHAALLRKCEHQVGVAMGAALEAGATWLTPGVDRTQALGALDRAVATAETSGFTLLAEAGRWFLGERLGGRRGEEMRMRSHRWLADQGVQNPARLAHMIAPGFRGPLG